MEKKKFLFVSLDALIADAAWQVVREGHDVKFYIDNPEDQDIADGMVPKVRDWKAEVEWADVIVFDDVLGQGALAAELRKKGKLVIGGTPYTDRLEDDRSFGQSELKRHGVKILPYEEFDDFDKAIEYVKAKPDAYVIKPSGEAANIKKLLFVGQEDKGEDVLRVLEAYKKTWSGEVKHFQLQKRVMSGVEVAVGAFFNGHEFVYPINVNFEHKKLFPGDLGVATGEMGTSMFWSKPNKLFNDTLRKMEPTLKQEGYVGYIDINCIVNGYGIYPLEFTARFGYPTLHIQAESLLTPLGEFFFRMANGDTFEFRTKSGFHLGTRIVVPPFPFDDEKTYESFSKDSAIIFKKPQLDGIRIEDVKIKKGEWTIAGKSGVVLVVAASGSTMRQAQTQMKNRIKNITIPNMYYRIDIGDRWYEDSDLLHTWGYLREA